MFITQQIRKVLECDGFVVIPNVIRSELIEELKRYVVLKMESEGVFNSSAYLEVGGPRHTIGLVTKYGWTKLDYTGPFQHILASDAAIYLLTCELLGATRLVPNFYEYKVSHPSNVKRKAGTKFEFIHVDGNYQKLLDLVDAGIDFTKLFYQIIVPITDMEPDGATVSFAKGFHKYWESVTRKALKQNCWTRRGWKATNPMKHIRKGDVNRYITSKWTPVTAPRGSVVVFNSVLPHGPSMNKSGKVRIAGYNFYAPLVSDQDASHPERASCFLPNSLSAVRTSVATGVCPKYAAHPWCNYELSKLSQNFYATIPYDPDCIPRSALAECLFGFRAWSDFEITDEAQQLYGYSNCDHSSRLVYLRRTQSDTTESLKKYNNKLEAILRQHELCEQLQGSNEECTICSRFMNSTLEQWIHSTQAVFHYNQNCDCQKCHDIKALGWVPFRMKGGCTCTKCKKVCK